MPNSKIPSIEEMAGEVYLAAIKRGLPTEFATSYAARKDVEDELRVLYDALAKKDERMAMLEKTLDDIEGTVHVNDRLNLRLIEKDALIAEARELLAIQLDQGPDDYDVIVDDLTEAWLEKTEGVGDGREDTPDGKNQDK